MRSIAPSGLNPTGASESALEHLLGRDAEGAAAAVPAAGMARQQVLILAIRYCGDMAAGEKAAAGLRSIGKPIADVVGPHPFVNWGAGLRPAAGSRSAELLEEPRFCILFRCRNRNPD